MVKRTFGQSVGVKICGLRQEIDIEAAVSGGADYVGFVFFEPSPRNVSLDVAKYLSRQVNGVTKVVVLVNATDREVENIVEAVSPGLLQLHGSETPERAAKLKEKFGIKVMKAFGVDDQSQLNEVDNYVGSVDQILIDAKPAPNAKLPGGNGAVIDWSILQGWNPQRPWMLAGGLDAMNVNGALKLSGANLIDVSSGVETAPGIKSAKKITAFLNTVYGREYAH